MPLFRRMPAGPEPDFDRCSDDTDLRRARDEALTGGWATARDLLHETGPDWDRRGHRVDILAETAAARPGWLREWLDAEPTDPAALTVLGWSEVHRAWLARGRGFAADTPPERLATFHEILREAAGHCRRAVESSPEDPTPWVPLLWLAIGQGGDPEMFWQLWRELTTRDPYNRLGHNAALQYLCQKWHGSHEEMYRFAHQVASTAPPGSPLALLPLQAHLEYVLERNAGGFYSAHSVLDHWKQPAVRTDIEEAMRRWLAPTGGHALHALAIHDRSVLACALSQAGWWAPAAEQFRAMGDYGYEYPWYYLGDPRVMFMKAREVAFRRT